MNNKISFIGIINKSYTPWESVLKLQKNETLQIKKEKKNISHNVGNCMSIVNRNYEAIIRTYNNWRKS